MRNVRQTMIRVNHKEILHHFSCNISSSLSSCVSSYLEHIWFIKLLCIGVDRWDLHTFCIRYRWADCNFQQTQLH